MRKIHTFLCPLWQQNITARPWWIFFFDLLIPRRSSNQVRHTQVAKIYFLVPSWKQNITARPAGWSLFLGSSFIPRRSSDQMRHSTSHQILCVHSYHLADFFSPHIAINFPEFALPYKQTIHN